jgi:hypothetical protein
MPLDMTEVADAVRGPLEAQLESVELISIDVTEDFDHDGDAILRIKVTFRADSRKLDPSKVKGLIRHLRTALAKVNEDRFPVVSFRTDTDVEDEASEAA